MTSTYVVAVAAEIFVQVTPSVDRCHWYAYEPAEGLPAHVPGDAAVKVCPTVVVPVTVGIAVASGGKKPETTLEVTVAVSTVFVAVTMTRICKFAWANVGE